MITAKRQLQPRLFALFGLDRVHEGVKVDLAESEIAMCRIRGVLAKDDTETIEVSDLHLSKVRGVSRPARALDAERIRSPDDLVPLHFGMLDFA